MLYNYIPGVEAFLKELRENGGKDSYSHKFK